MKQLDMTFVDHTPLNASRKRLPDFPSPMSRHDAFQVQGIRDISLVPCPPLAFLPISQL